MRKLKVGLVITRMDWGGSSDIVRTITCRLDPQLYDVRLVVGLTRFPSAKTKELFDTLKDKVIFLPQLRRAINPFLDMAALIGLYGVFRREKFDLCHTHTAKAGLLGRIAAYGAGCPVIIHTPHGHNFYGYGGALMSKAIIAVERLLSALTTRLIVFTELEKRDFIDCKVAPARKITVVSQGLEVFENLPQQSQKAGIKESLGLRLDEPVVGMVGRLEPIKGPGNFIEAAGQVAKEHPNVKFLIVGEGSLRRRLEKKAEELGIKEKCIFSGWKEQASEIISILDMLVLPSLNEAVGMVLIEAQSQGVPVIASRVGGIPEVVKDRQTGILVSPANPGELADAIKRLLKDEGLRKQMGRQGVDWVKGKFSAEAMVTAIAGVYRDTLKV